MGIFILTVYVAILGFTTAVGLIRYNTLDKATRLLVWYIGITFLTEATGITMATVYKRSNVLLYNLYSPLQFIMLSLYFNFSDERQKVHKAGWILSLIGIAVCILNAFFLQSLHKTATNFIVFESFVIIGMALFAFYRLLVSDEPAIFGLPRFWFSSIFLVFWSFTFFYWLVGAFIYNAMPDNNTWLKMMIWLINLVTYSAIAGVFLSYKKMRPA